MGKGTLYWITGLSGAGKTTIGNALYYELKKKQDNLIILDGDILNPGGSLTGGIHRAIVRNVPIIILICAKH